MAESNPPIALRLDGEHINLCRADDVLATLTFAEVLDLTQLATSWRQFILSKNYPPGAVISTTVSKGFVTWDALGENVVIQFGFEPLGTAVFEVAPDLFASLLARMQSILEERPAFRGNSN